MKPVNDRPQLGQPRRASAPTPRDRFRIQKLEERIAPHCKGRHRNFEDCFTEWKCTHRCA
jgi:hypothetical protein